MQLYVNYDRVYDPNNPIWQPSDVPSKNLPSPARGTLDYTSGTGLVCSINLRPTQDYLYLDQTGSFIPVKRIIEQEVNGGEPAIKGLKGNVNHDVINELSLAGVDYMQGNIFNQLFVQGAL